MFNLRRQNFEHDEVQSLHDEMEQVFRDVGGIRILQGRLLEDVALTTGQANFVNHRLGRTANYIVVRKSADARIWDQQSANNLQSKTLDLRCSANVTVSLWVF